MTAFARKAYNRWEHMRRATLLHLEILERDSVIPIEIVESLREAIYEANVALTHRLPYGRKLVKKPRRCAFAGTVNHDSYLKEDSGNRRYWPVYCTVIDLERLKADVDQLWAEALHWYREGAKWWVLPDERELFEFEQDKRFQEDAWQEPIEDYCIGKPLVTTGELMSGALKIDKARWDKMSQMRVGSIMRRMRWDRKRITLGGFQTYAYVRPGGDDDAPAGVREGADDVF